MAEYGGVLTLLKRLFSSDVIIRNIGGKQLKVVDTETVQSSGKFANNSLMGRYKGVHSTNPTSLYGHQIRQNYNYLRPQLYSEYDVMDQDAIIFTVLDIIADESTLKDQMGEIIRIKSSDEDLQAMLYNLFYDVLNVEFNLWGWVRQMCKYGDFFLKLDISEEYGVYNVTPYSAYHIERQEGFNEENPSEIRYYYSPEGYASGTSGYFNTPTNNNYENENRIFFDNYEVAHFRLLADVNYLPYGRSYIEAARKEFKKYTLMEDAMMLHRIIRAPEKRIFYINVGGIPPKDVDAHMEQTISNMKRIPYIDQETGEYNLQYNLMNSLEDFYIPQRGNDNSTKIDNINGLQWDGIQDVEYYRNKIFAALKVPKAFMGYEADLEGKATLAQQDIRFARTIERIQRIITSELNKIALIHLYTHGYRDERLVNFELSMQTPSIIFEQERVELMKSKAELTDQLMEQKLIPSDWIYDNIYNFSEEEYEEMRDLVARDSERRFRLSQIEDEGNDPKVTGTSYGTPHDLATLYGKERYMSNPGGVPEGYNEIEGELGRPEEQATNVRKQEGNFGKDRLGQKGMKGNTPNESEDINPKRRRPDLTLERAGLTLEKNKSLIKGLNRKIILFEKSESDSKLLDEDNLKE